MLLRGKRIFYFEDDAKNRAIVQLILEREGVTLGFERWVNKDSLGRLQSFGQVDVILLDLMFPNKVTGYDVYATLRATPEYANVPVIAISASDPSVELPKVKSLGFSGFIGKPIDLRTFALQINTVLEGQHVWAEH